MKRFRRWFDNIIIFGSLVWAFGVGCTDESGARRALEGQGFTNIELHGYAVGRCSDDDNTCTEFTATGPSGRNVRGAVGCGIGCKGCTVRTF